MKQQAKQLTSGVIELTFDNGKTVGFWVESSKIMVASDDFASAEPMGADEFADYLQDITTINEDKCPTCGMRGGDIKQT